MGKTKQEIAEAIYDWFFVQNNPKSFVTLSNGDESCRYRGEQPNQKCAVGCLIPDEMYLPIMEGMTVKGIFSANGVALPSGDRVYFTKLRDYIGSENTTFLTECQYWHDDTIPSFKSPSHIRHLRHIFTSNSVDISKMPLLG